MQRDFLFICINLAAVLLLVPSAAAQQARDAFGDPLPVGAVARIGTLRYRGADLHSYRQSPVLSPDGKRLLLSLSALQVTDLPHWKPRVLLADEKLKERASPSFSCHAFTPDSKTLVCYDNARKSLCFIDLDTGKRTKVCALPNAPSFSRPGMSISRDGKTLVLLGFEEKSRTLFSILVWDVTSEKLKRSISLGKQRADYSPPNFAVAPDGCQLVRSTDDSTRVASKRFSLEFWNLKTGEQIRKVALDGLATEMYYGPDGTWLAVTVAQAFPTNAQPVLRIYDTANARELHNLRMRRSSSEPGGYMQPLAVAPDGQAIYLSEDNFTRIGQWDPRTGERVKTFAVPVRVEIIRQIVCTPQGKVFALGQHDNAVHFWEVKSGTVYSPRNVPEAPITEVAFSPHGELFVSSYDAQVAWWDARTGTRKRTQKIQRSGRHGVDRHLPPRFREDFGRLQLSPDSKFFFAFGRGSSAVYEVETGQLLYNETGGAGLCFFDHGAKAASLRGGTVRYWDSRTGRDVARFDVPFDDQKESAHNLAVSPSGKHFAVAYRSGYYAGRVALGNAERKTIDRQWSWKTESTSFAPLLAFSPDERWLFVRTYYGPAFFVRPGPSPQKEHVLPAKGFIEAFAFSPDSRQFAYRVARPHDVGDSPITVVEMASKKVRLVLAGHGSSNITHLAYAPDGGLLASGSYDGTVLVWQAGLAAFANKRATPAQPKERLKEWLAQVGDADASRAFQAMIQLVRAPQQAVTLLGQALPPAPPPELHGRPITAWIADLHHARFAIRSKASAVLLKLAEGAETPLRDALARAPNLEAKRQLERLLERITGRDLTPQEILHVRAVELLEAIASPEARAVLGRWAKGSAKAVLTEHARMALKRMH